MSHRLRSGSQLRRFSGICLFTVGFAMLASGAFPLGVGIFLLFGAVSIGFCGLAAYSAIPPKKDLAWHKNDLAQQYKNYFSHSSTNQPEAITPGTPPQGCPMKS